MHTSVHLHHIGSILNGDNFGNGHALIGSCLRKQPFDMFKSYTVSAIPIWHFLYLRLGRVIGIQSLK
jgi:hypothetical protein